METDRIEREIFIKASRARVWRALSDAREFGEWFGMDVHGQSFEPGKTLRATIHCCGHDGLEFDFLIDRVEPERLFSYRWHPCAIDPAYDYSKEPMTLVTFTLEEVEGGTLLKVVESGFDGIPAERLAEAYRLNSSGWDTQIKNIEQYAIAK